MHAHRFFLVDAYLAVPDIGAAGDRFLFRRRNTRQARQKEREREREREGNRRRLSFSREPAARFSSPFRAARGEEDTRKV